MFRTTVFLLFFALPVLFFSQPAEPYHKVYNGDNCYPFPFLQSVYLDNEGLMWVSSSQKSGGVCVFNGEKCIKRFTEKDGLTDNVIPYIYIDDADTVYLAGFYHGLSVVYKNRVVKTYPIVEKYKCGPLNAIVKDTTGVLWVSTLSGRIFTVFNDSVREMKLPGFAKGLTMVFSAVTDKYNRIWFGAYSGHLFYYDNAEKKFVNALTKFDIPQNDLNQLVLVNGYTVVSTSGDTASYIIEKDKKRVFSKDYDFYYNTDGYLTGMSYDSISVFRYDGNSLKKIFSVSVDYKFLDFNFLMTLFNSGNLYVIGENQVVEINPNVFVYGNSDGEVGINDFQPFGDSIWVVGRYWGYIKDDKFVSVKEELKKLNPDFTEVFRTDYTISKTYKVGEKIYFSVTNNRWFYFDPSNLKIGKVTELPGKFLLAGAGETDNGVKVWAGLNGIITDSAGIRKFYKFTDKGVVECEGFEPEKSLNFEKVYPFGECVWVPTSTGLIVYNEKRGFTFLKDTVFTGKNTQLVRDKYGIVWFVNRSHFGYINPANYDVVTIDSVLDIVGHKSLYRFTGDREGNLVLASFYLEKDSVEIKSIVPVLYKDFAGRWACPFYTQGKYVYSTLWNRIAKINIEGLASQSKRFKPQLDYLGVYLTGRDTTEVLSKNNFNISSDYNVFKFDFATINYLLSSSAFQIKYRLNGYEEDWHKVEDVNHFEIEYAALPAGDYKLEVVLMSSPGQEYDRKEVSFSIVPHFYETLWFKALVFIFILVVAVYFAYKLAEKRKQKEINMLTLQRQLNKMRYEFLQYKMEPHFVFNVLSSIKYLIIDNKQDEASNAISDFSVLIRNLMTFGDTDFISLEEEVEFLKKFLALEKLRFEDKFEYEIKVSDRCKDADILIPPMIIQPLAENAIKHGFIKGKREGGKLLISFECKGDKLTVTVKDNGKGFDMSAGVFKEDHALGLIKKRIAIYKELYDTEIEFSIKSEPGKGTEAKIII